MRRKECDEPHYAGVSIIYKRLDKIKGTYVELSVFIFEDIISDEYEGWERENK